MLTFEAVVAFVKLNAAAFKLAAFAVASLVAVACGLWLPTTHSRLIAEVFGLGIAAVAGKEYLP